MSEALDFKKQLQESVSRMLPEGWEVCPIEDKLADIIDYRGKTPQKTTSGIPLITAKNVRDGYLDPEPREYIREEDYDRWMTRGIPDPGDVLFTTEAPLGNVARFPGYKAALAQRLLTLRSKPDELDSGYLFWALVWSDSRQRLEQRSTGSTVLGIKQSIFRKVVFRFPPLPEQQKIAQILDTIDQLIAVTDTHITKLKTTKAGLLHDLLTRGIDEHGELRDPTCHPEQFEDSPPLGRIPKDWDVLPVEALLEGRPKNGYSPKEVNEWTGKLILGLGCLTPEGFEPCQLKNSPANDSKTDAALLNDGDLLISRSNTREFVALVGIYRTVGVPTFYPDLMMRLTPNPRTSNRFLELLMRHTPVRRQLTSAAQGTSASMVKINSETVLATIVAVPQHEEQTKIIQAVDQYNYRIKAKNKHIEKLKLLKKGLMADLLTGQVRVKLEETEDN